MEIAEWNKGGNVKHNKSGEGEQMDKILSFKTNIFISISDWNAIKMLSAMLKNGGTF